MFSSLEIRKKKIPKINTQKKKKFSSLENVIKFSKQLFSFFLHKNPSCFPLSSFISFIIKKSLNKIPISPKITNLLQSRSPQITLQSIKITDDHNFILLKIFSLQSISGGLRKIYHGIAAAEERKKCEHREEKGQVKKKRSRHMICYEILSFNLSPHCDENFNFPAKKKEPNMTTESL